MKKQKNSREKKGINEKDNGGGGKDKRENRWKSTREKKRIKRWGGEMDEKVREKDNKREKRGIKKK